MVGRTSIVVTPSQYVPLLMNTLQLMAVVGPPAERQQGVGRRSPDWNFPRARSTWAPRPGSAESTSITADCDWSSGSTATSTTSAHVMVGTVHKRVVLTIGSGEGGGRDDQRKAVRVGGQTRWVARPTTVSISMGPKIRLSAELARLSPRTHSSRSSIVSGPKSEVVVEGGR